MTNSRILGLRGKRSGVNGEFSAGVFGCGALEGVWL